MWQAYLAAFGGIAENGTSPKKRSRRPHYRTQFLARSSQKTQNRDECHVTGREKNTSLVV